MAKLEITLKKSLAGKNQIHRRTANALGLRRLNQQVIHEDTPSIRGMINRSGFLFEVKEIGG